jgi:phage shock protein PspC (stress-responsive transcriptional regulator)
VWSGTIGDDGDMTQQTPTRTPQRRLERSREDRLFAGVAGGLGFNLGINPWWIRFAFIVLAFFGGFGVILYLAAWIVIPDEGEKDPIVTRWIANFDTSNGAMVFGAVLLGGAALLVISNVSSAPGSLVLAGVLFVVGLLLYRGDFSSEKRGQGGTPDSSSTDDGAAVVAQDVGGDGAAVSIAEGGVAEMTTDGATDVVPVPPAPRKAPKPRRERSMLGRLTIAVGLIVLAGMVMIDIAFARVEIEPVVYAATAVAVIGVGLVVGSWIGRARWLIIIGLFLLPGLWLSTLAPSSWNFSAGDVRFAPLTVSEIDTSYAHGAGRMEVDLTGLNADELAEVGTVEVSLGAGEMTVRLPAGVGVRMNAEVGAGEIRGPFRTEDGFAVEVDATFGPEPTVLDLNLEVGVGTITITGEGGVFDAAGIASLEGSAR